MPIFNDQSQVPQDKPVYPLNVLGKVAVRPFFIWANEDCSNKSDSFDEAKAIRMELYNDGGTSVHLVDADGVEVVDAEIEAHEALANAGYFAGARKPDVKPEFPGAFMVNDPQDPDGFAIVGDDIAVLILEARDHLIEPAYEREVSINTDQRLEKLQALGFDSESDYRDHHRVLEASRDMAARQKADSIAAGSTAFNDRKVPAVRAIEALALLCQADGRAQAKGRYAELVGMAPDRFVSEAEGGHGRVLAEKLAARFSGAAGALMQNDLNRWLAGLGGEGDNAIQALDQARTQREVPSYTGQTNVAEHEASSKLPLALEKLVPHVLHYASMPNAHADAHRDVADARRVLADFAKDAQKVSISIDQLSQPGVQLVQAISDAALLVEINRRGILQPLYGAIGAMHDHLDRTGALDEHLSQYLAYRLRREEAAITGMPDSAARVANWQECIDQLDREARAVKVEDSPSPGM